MSDTSKRVDEILDGDVDNIDRLMELDRLLSVERRVEAGQGEAFADAASKEGDLMNGKTAKDIARLKRLNP